jgi:hypothetical protein
MDFKDKMPCDRYIKVVLHQCATPLCPSARLFRYAARLGIKKMIT